MSNHVCITLNKNNLNDSVSCELKTNSRINEVIEQTSSLSKCVRSKQKCEELPEAYEEIQAALCPYRSNKDDKNNICPVFT